MKSLLRHLAVFVAVLLFSTVSFAEEEAPAPEVEYDQIQVKYELTDEEMQALKDSGESRPGQIRMAHYKANSDKTMEEIIAMRTEQKMGWGKIAKTLGLHPSVNGRAVSDINSNRAERASEKLQAKADRRQARVERKAERQQKKQERRAERRNNKNK